MKNHNITLLHSKKNILLYFLLTASFALAGCGDLTSMAQGFLYANATANKATVPDEPPPGYGQKLLDVPYANGNMKVHLWYYTSPQAPNGPVLIHFHGNAENIGSLYQGNFLKKMETLGFNFVVADYPGYGKSTGNLSQSTVMASMEAAVLWTRENFKNSHLIAWGWSIGTGIATQVAYQNQNIINGLILTSSFTSVRSLAKEKFGNMASEVSENWYLMNEWDSEAAAPNIHIPVLMQHGTADTLIPFSFGQALSQKFPPGLVEFYAAEGKEHNNIFTDPQVWLDIQKFTSTH